MKDLRFVDIVEAWKRKPAWLRAFAWLMFGIILGTFVKGG